MKRLSTWILVIAIASVPGVSGRSANLASRQSDADIIAAMDHRMALLDSLIFTTPAPEAATNPLEGSVAIAPDSAYSEAVGAVVDAQVRAVKAQTGIQLTGQTYYRADGALGIDDEDEAVSRYLGKIQAEARWYFLQSGLLKRSGRIDEIRLKGDIDRLTHERGRTEPGLYARREHLRAVSDSVLASVMLHRVANLQLLEDAYMYLLSNENISGDLIGILDERAEAERRLATISTMPVRATSLSSVVAGTVSVDTTAILSALSHTDIDLQILDLKARLAERQASNTTWWSDVRLAPFVRYSHYFRHTLPSSSNVDVGMSFTIPVNGEAAQKRKALRAEKALIDCQRNDLIDRAADKVRYLDREISRLNCSIEGEWHRAQALRSYLQARREAYNHREGEYNRLAALKEYNSYLRCLENIIEMQYRRDSYLADLQALIPAEPILDHCRFEPLDNSISR